MRKISWIMFVSLLVVLSVSLSGTTFASPIAPDNVESPALNVSTSVAPVADTYTNSSSPSTNYGSAAQLRTDDSPVMKGFVKFNVLGLSGTVTKATLRLYATSSSSGGYKVFQFTNSWSESTLNHNNAPGMGTVLGTSGAVTSGAWTSVDVTSFVKGNGTFSFGLKDPSGTALTFGSRESANKPQLIIETGSTTLPAPTPTVAPTAAPVTSGSVKVLCDGKVFDGYTRKVFDLYTAEDQNPNVLKVIRNCVFRNSTEPAIVIRNAKNVLIEGNTFENIRTHIAGVGVHAINIPCRAAANCTSGNRTENITIRNNAFRYIGADGIQLGEETRYISRVYIQNNEFVGRDDVGENAVDVKGVEGPIYITGNKVHGFRPCESPKTKVPGNQDCSGSPGEGIVIHDGGGAVKTPAYNVTLENNDVYDNKFGIVAASGVRNIVIRGNRSFSNLSIGILVNNAYSVSVTGNSLSNNPTHIRISGTPLSGGTCTANSNTFVGGGTNLSLSSSNCN